MDRENEHFFNFTLIMMERICFNLILKLYSLVDAENIFFNVTLKLYIV